MPRCLVLDPSTIGVTSPTPSSLEFCLCPRDTRYTLVCPMAYTMMYACTGRVTRERCSLIPIFGCVWIACSGLWGVMALLLCFGLCMLVLFCVGLLIMAILIDILAVILLVTILIVFLISFPIERFVVVVSTLVCAL